MKRYILLVSLSLIVTGLPAQQSNPVTTMNNYPVRYKTAQIDHLNIFYREAGPVDAPVLLLMHGFPSSSFMFRNLIGKLKHRYHIIAPDYPGFGHSSVPSIDSFEYSFDQLSRVMERFVDKMGIRSFSMYIQDYGAPVGLRLVTRRPELLQCLIIQNGNAYEEGLGDAWAPLKAIWTDPHNPEKKQEVINFMNLAGTKFQYAEGVGDASLLSPDTYTLDQYLLERPGMKEIQYQLLYDYRTNISEYASFQKTFRQKQPPALVVWGENDVFFLKKGALAYGRDLNSIEFNFYPTGHFALEEYGDDIAVKIDQFLIKHPPKELAGSSYD
jgi:pimeloyl-ACP methyl ester carboxylesterase